MTPLPHLLALYALTPTAWLRALIEDQRVRDRMAEERAAWDRAWKDANRG